jgi:hypothetical protein
MPAPDDLATAYAEYLARYQELVGPREVGQYGKWGRHLVKKYSREEFQTRHDQFVKLERACRHILETGATMNDAVTLAFEEAAAEILIEANALELKIESSN